MKKSSYNYLRKKFINLDKLEARIFLKRGLTGGSPRIPNLMIFSSIMSWWGWERGSQSFRKSVSHLSELLGGRYFKPLCVKTPTLYTALWTKKTTLSKIPRFWSAFDSFFILMWKQIFSKGVDIIVTEKLNNTQHFTLLRINWLGNADTYDKNL